MSVDGELVPGVEFDRLSVTATSFEDGKALEPVTLELEGEELEWPMRFNFLSGEKTGPGTDVTVSAQAWLGEQRASSAEGKAILLPGSGAVLELFVGRAAQEDGGGEAGAVVVDAGMDAGNNGFDAGMDAGTVQDAGQEADAGMTVDAGEPPPDAGVQKSFYRGINLNGGAVTIDGNVWESWADAQAAGLTTNATGFVNGSLTPTPAVDADTSAMLNTAVWFNNASLWLDIPIANGDYEAYFWILENYMSNVRAFDLQVEGTTVATSIATLPLPEWRRYGPYQVSVQDGRLDVDVVYGRGDPHLMGIELYR